MNVLALPHCRNFNSRNNFESDFLGRFFGYLVAVQVVVVRDGNATKPFAFAKHKQFIDRERSVGKLGVHVQVCIAAIFSDDCRILLHG